MENDLYRRTEREIRRLGRDRKTARRYAEFFTVSLLSVEGAALVLLKREVQGRPSPAEAPPSPEGPGDGGLFVSSLLPPVISLPFTVPGGIAAGARAGAVLPAPFRRR